MTSFRVTNFRSIIDSGYIDIKNRATVLIGSNRAGKSSLLNALEKLNYDETFNKFDLTQLGDISFNYMNKKITGDKIKIIEAKFSPVKRSDDDEIIITKYYDSSYHIKQGSKEYDINLTSDIFNYVDKLEIIAHELKNPDILSQILGNIKEIKNMLDNGLDYNKIFMILDTIKATVPDGPLKRDITQAVDDCLARIAGKEIPEPLKSIPRFVYFSAYERLEDKVTLTELNENPDEHKTFINLLKMAQININIIDTLDVDQKIAYFEKASSIISKKLSDVWGENEGKLEIRYENGKEPMLLVMITPETTRNYLVPPSMESDGFQWFLSVFINLNASTDGDYHNSFLLLDDLGVLLHPGKQKNFLEFLRESLPVNIYIIYTTHLPFFIPLDIPESILLLSRVDTSTKILDLMNLQDDWKDQRDVLAPVRAALGYGILDSFFVNKTIFFVSSIADQIILNFIWDRYNVIKNNIKSKDVAFIGQNEDDSIYSYALWARYNNFPFYIILNDSKYGQSLKEKLSRMNIDEHVKLIPSKIGVDESTVEDFIDPDIIAKAYVKHHKIYSEDQLQYLTSILRNRKGVIRILNEYSEKNNIDYDRSGTANEIINLLKSGNYDSLVINLYNIVFPFIVEEDYSYHSMENAITNEKADSEKGTSKSSGSIGGGFISKLFSRKIKNIKNTIPGYSEKNYEFSFESEGKILSIAVSSGIALLSDQRGLKKTMLLSKIIKYAKNNNRHIIILATSREKDIRDQLNIDYTDTEILVLSPAYFRQRLVTDVGQAMTLAGKLYVEIKNSIKEIDNSLIIMYRIDDVIPIHKKGNSIIYENEFWRVFFQFMNSINKQQLLLLTADNELYTENILMYVNTIIKTKVENNYIDVSIEKNTI
ncbi:AAA family ATPase [Acidiplasma sp. MBA-1]|uniref:AAA family ATPase n=1 Tax=Acidiplasma sp. MBA-1 TaxID=1293648 RepID=UPI001E525CB4|nr:AAA family ATPase [Acidiplasma sp. MBA-1]